MRAFIDTQGRTLLRHAREASGRRAIGAAFVVVVAACSAVDTGNGESLGQKSRFGDANISSHRSPDGDIDTTVSGPSGEPLLVMKWHQATHVLTYQLPTSAPFDLQLDLMTVTTDATDSMAYYIYKQTSGYHDSPGCDAPAQGLTTACYSPCCAYHDECYDKNGCTQSSWFFKGSWTCIGCNAQAVGCIGAKATTGNCDGECSGNGDAQVQCYDKSYGQYCAGGCGDQNQPPCDAKLLSGQSYECPTGGEGGGAPSDPGGTGGDGTGASDPSGGSGARDPGGTGASDPSGGAGASDPSGGAGASDPSGGTGASDPSGGTGASDPSGGYGASDPGGE